MLRLELSAVRTFCVNTAPSAKTNLSRFSDVEPLPTVTLSVSPLTERVNLIAPDTEVRLLL